MTDIRRRAEAAEARLRAVEAERDEVRKAFQAALGKVDALAEIDEVRLRTMGDERDAARRETQDNIRCAVEIRVRLRAVVEALRRLRGDIRAVHQSEPPHRMIPAQHAVEALRQADAALRLGEGAAETGEKR